MSKVIILGASHGEEEVIFYLRSISVAEETHYTSRYSEISDLDSDEKKAQLEYEIITDSLASWSDKAPVIKVDGKISEDDTEFENPEAAVRAFFAARTNEKERTAQQVVLQYRRKLQPKIVFY